MATDNNNQFNFDYSKFDFPIKLEQLTPLVQDILKMPTAVPVSGFFDKVLFIISWITLLMKAVSVWALCVVWEKQRDKEYAAAKQQFELNQHDQAQHDVNV